jgi:amino acid adenylation domain-containing protein
MELRILQSLNSHHVVFFCVVVLSVISMFSHTELKSLNHDNYKSFSIWGSKFLSQKAMDDGEIVERPQQDSLNSLAMADFLFCIFLLWMAMPVIESVVSLIKQWPSAQSPESVKLTQSPPLLGDVPGYGATINRDRDETPSGSRRSGSVQSLEWWKKHLLADGEVPKLDLTLDRPRGLQSSFSGVEAVLKIPCEIEKAIRSFSQHESVSLFDVLLALHSTWLCRLSKSTELVVWIPADAGQSSETRYLPLRMRLKGSFMEFVHTVHSTRQAALCHRNVSSSYLSELVGAEGIGGQNVFMYHDLFESSFQCSKQVPRSGMQMDAELGIVRDANGKLSGTALFNADLFTQASAERMANVFITLAQGVMFNGLTDIWKLPLVTHGDEMELDMLHGAVCEEHLPTAPELLQACIDSSPGNIALEYEPTGEKLTYGELGARVHSLAACLLDRGIRPNALVAMICERSIEMTVGVFGVWAVGAGYMPIEPDSSNAFIEFLVADLITYCTGHGDTALLLTQSSLWQKHLDDSADIVRAFPQPVFLNMIETSPGHTPHLPPVSPTNLSYCMYTTGTTGRAKGVLVDQRRTAFMAHNLQKIMPLSSDCVTAQKVPFTLNPSVEEMFWPLVNASKSVILKPNAIKDPLYMLRVMQKYELSVVFLHPTLLDIMLMHLQSMQQGSSAFPALRAVYTSSDTLKQPVIDKFFTLIPNAKLYDMYGTTETGRVLSLTCSFKNSGLAKTVGKPLSGLQAYITNGENKELQRLPMGMIGELVVSSPGVAQGYLNMPEKSADVFITNPFGARKCGKDAVGTYRTGDMMKWCPDGQLVYVGRTDFMVKYHGLRIELGDIEDVCQSVSGVQGAVVVMRETEEAGKHLVAYIRPRTASKSDVMKACREKLPSHMVPLFAVCMDDFPYIGANKKIDRKRLPSPQDIQDCPVLSPSEEAQLDSFHGAESTAKSNVVERFIANVNERPNQIAMEHEPTGKKLTYAELGDMVFRLARHLSEFGVSRDLLVGLRLERSIDMTLGIYGIWAAGGAYVPIDLEAPESHLKFILDDIYTHNAGIAEQDRSKLMLLTQSWRMNSDQQSLTAIIRNRCTSILCLDTFEPCKAIDAMPYVMQTKPASQDLAYVLYTSGSTGRNKGVLVQHDGLANQIQEHCNIQGVTSNDVILQKTAYTFDVSLLEIGVAPAIGAKLVVAKHGGERDLQYCIDLISKCKVSMIQFTPTVYKIFLDILKDQSSNLKSVDTILRVVECTGEAMSEETAYSSLRLLPNVALYDGYGPTEATITVTKERVTEESLKSAKTIGRAMNGVQAYITTYGNTPLQRMPIGMEGELLLGGVQVARGYLNLPEVTSKAFVKNVFSKDSSSTIYRTGDLVKWRSDGTIVYIGRIDRQMKINGVRIELAEIESAVRTCAGVQDALVTTYEGAGKVKQLAVYVVPKCIDQKAVMQACRKLLPPKVVPSIVLGVDAWPRNASGKIDQKQLPAPTQNLPEEEDSMNNSLDAKIQEMGLDAALNDESLQMQGLNSFAIMRIHAKLINGSVDSNGEQHIEVEQTDRQLGLIACLGHMWCVLMFLVLLEWVVAYWEWYQAIPGLSTFRVHDYPLLEKMNSLGRFMGDPCFVAIGGITDVRDAIDGKTGVLIRRWFLFLLVSLVTALPTKMILQDTYVDLGYLDSGFGSDPNRVCGIWNGGAFIFARSAFLPVTVLMSLAGKVNCIPFAGWPWAFLGFALLVPALIDGLPAAQMVTDTHELDFQTFALRKTRFVKELCPYYFLYPLFVGGTRFPAWIVGLKAGRSWKRSMILTVIGFIGFMWYWSYLEIPNTHAVDRINEDHAQWKHFLAQWNPHKNWDLLNRISAHLDMYAAFQLGMLFLLLCSWMPTTPSIFSYYGAQCLGCYSCFPLTLIAGGHFFGIMFMSIAEPYRAYCVPAGVLTFLLLVIALTSHPIVPEFVLEWVSGQVHISELLNRVRSLRLFNVFLDPIYLKNDRIASGGFSKSQKDLQW